MNSHLPSLYTAAGIAAVSCAIAVKCRMVPVNCSLHLDRTNNKCPEEKTDVEGSFMGGKFHGFSHIPEFTLLFQLETGEKLYIFAHFAFMFSREHFICSPENLPQTGKNHCGINFQATNVSKILPHAIGCNRWL